ncbi:hypothetical protein CJF32_00003219 [Rutstroemia sp. NJR-2017a WRK4]|nr:hypothetical protein CJF32_00003219 [Rutstroemia sp. NJR-2017a WRK4]
MSTPSNHTPAGLEQFTLFPLLPAELRLKIWRQSFPPSRTIVLTPNPSTTQASSAPLPTTLSVCSESRAETLHHYTILYRHEFKSRNTLSTTTSRSHLQPICINPVLDIVYFPAHDLVWPGKGRSKFNEWISFLESRAPGILSRAKSVELGGLDWENTLYLHLKYQETLKGKETGVEYAGQGGACKWEELNYGVLLRLGRVREIRCRYAHEEYWGNFEEQLEKFLGFHGEVWGDNGRPRVKRVV